MLYKFAQTRLRVEKAITVASYASTGATGTLAAALFTTAMFATTANFRPNCVISHRNPVKRGLRTSPEEWPWSSFRHYAFGEMGIVEIESE